jgi:hypothetical protein
VVVRFDVRGLLLGESTPQELSGSEPYCLRVAGQGAGNIFWANLSSDSGVVNESLTKRPPRLLALPKSKSYCQTLTKPFSIAPEAPVRSNLTRMTFPIRPSVPSRSTAASCLILSYDSE